MDSQKTGTVNGRRVASLPPRLLRVLSGAAGVRAGMAAGPTVVRQHMRQPDGLRKITDCRPTNGPGVCTPQQVVQRLQKAMGYRPTNAGKSAMACASRSWLQVACVLVLCLVSAAANAQVGFMDAALNGRGFLPTEDPYCSGPIPRFLGRNPQSTNLCTPVAVPSITTPTAFLSADGLRRYRGVVDWVLVELRDAAGDSNTAVGSTVIARKPGFLLSNGRVVEAATWQERSSEDRSRCLAFGSDTPLEDDSICPNLVFEGIAISDNLYVVIRHRNHIDIMSAVAVAATGTTGDTYIYDFSTGEDAAWNSGQKVLFGQLARRIRPGIAMMFAGDVSFGVGDESANLVHLNFDYNDIRNDFGQSGYLQSDVNMDGTVSPTDDWLNILLSNVGAGTQVPR